MIREITEILKERMIIRRLKRLIRKVEANNSKPRAYKVCEHQGWGDRISIRQPNKDNTYRIDGNMMGLRVGDRLVYESQGGNMAYGVIIELKYEYNPRDLFFGTLAPAGVWEEKMED